MDPVWAAVGLAVIGPLGAYLVAARRFSGKIESSDAKALWAESRDIRDEYKSQIGALTTTVGVLEARVGVVENQNASLARENTHLVQQIRDLSDTITELRAEIVSLTGELQRSHARVDQLEEEAGDGRQER